MDERSATLPFGLYASYLLMIDLTVLEFVSEAGMSPFVQWCLEYHLAGQKTYIGGGRSFPDVILAASTRILSRSWLHDRRFVFGIFETFSGRTGSVDFVRS